ncbi:MAG: J domain-containing protein, partial [Methanomicrobiales archaeon]|nr:J domain-containing protein [Methanomicrobiales archaeon]
KPEPRFRRDGDNLLTKLQVSPAQAVLGTTVDVTTIDERHLEVKVPAGTQGGRKLRISGEGIRKRGRPGDLLVEIEVVIPKHVTGEQRELYEKILELEGKKKVTNAGNEKKGFFESILGG